MAVGIQASWQDLNITIDGTVWTKKFKSQDWSSIEEENDDYCAKVPNNNSFVIKNEP
jgi:hypothetical protein